MKKFILTHCLLFVVVGLFAQQSIMTGKGMKSAGETTELSMMKNLDFTAWYTESFFGLGQLPEGWGIVSCKPNQQKTTDAQSGTYAVYLETGLVNLPVFGIFNKLLPGVLEGGDAITAAPTAMTFWAKGDLLSNDVAGVEVTFRKNGQDKGGGFLALQKSDLGNAYKQFTINLTYTGNGQPDSLYVSAGSGGGTENSTVTPGSKLYFDNVAFIYGPAATVTPELWNAGTVAVGSNSTQNFVLKNAGKGTLTVSNVSTLSAPWSTNFNASSVSLGEGETYPFTITFTPTAEGTVNASFVITSNGGTKTVSLSGTGLLGDPKLVSFTPANDAMEVPLNAEVSVTFNMNITSSQLQEITIFPNPGGVIPKIVGNKLIIAHSNFEPYCPYIVNVPDGVIDRYDLPILWGFGTGNTITSITAIDKNEVKVYPNPSNGNINVKVSENSVVKVFDLSGKLIKTHDYVEANSILNFTMPAGAYFIQVESNDSVKINKIIVN